MKPSAKLIHLVLLVCGVLSGTFLLVPQAQGEKVTSIFLPFIQSGGCPCYYVDYQLGQDTNAGTSPTLAWKTLTRVKAAALQPGDKVLFRRGQTWNGLLTIAASGTQVNPIVISAYGEGERPVLRNPGDASNTTRAIILLGDWVIVESLRVQDTFDAGIRLETGADHNIVRDVEITNTGLGIQINGDFNQFTRNFVHDLHLVINTPGGMDDYGAVGVVLHGAAHSDVSYNRFERCRSASYDYGFDGGAVEWYGQQADQNNVHHNWVQDSQGFLEVGGGSASDNVVAYNVSLNNGRFSLLNLAGKYASIVQNFRVENNTIIEQAGAEQGWLIFAFDAAPTPATFSTRNNIVYAEYFQYIARPIMSNYTHDHNLYQLAGGTALGFSLGIGELQGNPLWVNLAGRDFHLQPGSPATNAGVALGYSLDFDGHPVPVGVGPDLGAFEFSP